MTIDLYLYPSVAAVVVVVWNYWTLVVMVAFDGYLWELFFDIHLEETNQINKEKKYFIVQTRSIKAEEE